MRRGYRSLRLGRDLDRAVTFARDCIVDAETAVLSVGSRALLEELRRAERGLVAAMAALPPGANGDHFRRALGRVAEVQQDLNWVGQRLINWNSSRAGWTEDEEEATSREW